MQPQDYKTTALTLITAAFTEAGQIHDKNLKVVILFWKL